MSNMYAETKTWNPFKGCLYDCLYCRHSFQKQAKRIGDRCQDCYDYVPHFHEERLKRIPSAPRIFVGGNGDLSFCSLENIKRIIARIRDHNKRTDKTYYLQSKDPIFFNDFVDLLPENCYIGTTLETDKFIFNSSEYETYREISLAPAPKDRYRDFKKIDYPKKYVTIEPVIDFNLDRFSSWIRDLKPDHVWIGYNTKPKKVKLPEPNIVKTKLLVESLEKHGIEVRPKHMRGGW